jgi:hypothetical protein
VSTKKCYFFTADADIHSVIALSKLYDLKDPRLAQIQVKGGECDQMALSMLDEPKELMTSGSDLVPSSDGRIMTRSRARISESLGLRLRSWLRVEYLLHTGRRQIANTGQLHMLTLEDSNGLRQEVIDAHPWWYRCAFGPGRCHSCGILITGDGLLEKTSGYDYANQTSWDYRSIDDFLEGLVSLRTRWKHCSHGASWAASWATSYIFIEHC